MTVDRFLINPSGQTDDEVVDFIMGYLEEHAALTERQYVRDSGGRFATTGGTGGGSKGIAEPAAVAASSLVSSGSANVSSADLDDALYELAANAPPKTNLMGLSVDGKRVTGDTGLPVSRKDMPQFDGEVKSQFVGELERSGVTVARKSVDPSTLTPGQNEIDAAKTSQMFVAYDRGQLKMQDPIIVSSDNRVIDGNHRYAALSAARQDGHPDATIDVIQVDMPAAQLLPLGQSWTASHGIASRALGA